MKHFMICSVAVLSLLIGCENTVTEQKPEQSETNEPSTEEESYILETETETGQVLRVLSAYKYVETYAEKAEETEDPGERFTLWEDIVLDEVEEACLTGEHDHFVEGYVQTPPKDLEKLQKDIAMLRASEPEGVVLEAMEKSAEALPGPDTTVCLLPRGNVNDIAGINLDPGKISVFYLPGMNKEHVQKTVAHEYHHSILTATYTEDYEWDLLGSILFEGKAEYFASMLYGEPVIQSYNMNEKQEKRLWNQVKGSLDSTDQDQVDEVLYGEGAEFPYSFGYIVGYHIVREYVEQNPEATIEEWTKLSAERLYEDSGYD